MAKIFSKKTFARRCKKLNNILRPTASFFGLGEEYDRLTDKLQKSVGHKPITSGMINQLIDDLVNEARAKGLKNIDELQSKLNSLDYSSVLSNVAREAIQRESFNTKRALQQAQANFDAAEELVTTARNTAGRADYASGYERYGNNSQAGEAKSEAMNLAKTARNIYEKVEGGLK